MVSVPSIVIGAGVVVAIVSGIVDARGIDGGRAIRSLAGGIAGLGAFHLIAAAPLIVRFMAVVVAALAVVVIGRTVLHVSSTT